jgi:ribosomal protein S18 acetylase RimI-like enzyme
LSDLVIDKAYQQQGIGKKLLDKARHIIPKARIILIYAPDAVDYYPKIGMLKKRSLLLFPIIERIG